MQTNIDINDVLNEYTEYTGKLVRENVLLKAEVKTLMKYIEDNIKDNEVSKQE